MRGHHPLPSARALHTDVHYHPAYHRSRPPRETQQQTELLTQRKQPKAFYYALKNLLKVLMACKNVSALRIFVELPPLKKQTAEIHIRRSGGLPAPTHSAGRSITLRPR